MQSTNREISEMPSCLKAEDINGYLGISRSSAYALIKSDGFPHIQIGKRLIVPKSTFFQWVDSQIAGSQEVR